MSWVVDYLTADGVYVVIHKFFCASTCGLPQTRKLLFLIALRADAIREEFVWPTTLEMLPLLALLGPRSKGSSHFRRPGPPHALSHRIQGWVQGICCCVQHVWCFCCCSHASCVSLQYCRGHSNDSYDDLYAQWRSVFIRWLIFLLAARVTSSASLFDVHVWLLQCQAAQLPRKRGGQCGHAYMASVQVTSAIAVSVWKSHV